MRESCFDPTVFYKHCKKGEVIILVVYVYNITMTGNEPQESSTLRSTLMKEFDIQTLGEMKYFQGKEVAHSSHGIMLSQLKCIHDLLEETGLKTVNQQELQLR